MKDYIRNSKKVRSVSFKLAGIHVEETKKSINCNRTTSNKRPQVGFKMCTSPAVA